MTGEIVAVDPAIREEVPGIINVPIEPVSIHQRSVRVTVSANLVSLEFYIDGAPDQHASQINAKAGQVFPPGRGSKPTQGK